MILWINGPFGGGKSTLADELIGRMPGALKFDPEYVGFVLREFVPMPPSNDFQDIPLWRKLVADFAVGMLDEYKSPLIVPMTLLRDDYRDEIFDRIAESGYKIQHIFLTLSHQTLTERVRRQVLRPDDLEKDEEIRADRIRKHQMAVKAQSGLSSDTWVISNDQVTIAQVVDEVLTRLGGIAPLSSFDDSRG